MNAVLCSVKSETIACTSRTSASGSHVGACVRRAGGGTTGCVSGVFVVMDLSSHRMSTDNCQSLFRCFASVTLTRLLESAQDSLCMLCHSEHAACRCDP